MKNFIIWIPALVWLFQVPVAGQSLTDGKKYIDVTGLAEKTIIPDEIELEIILTEYTKDGQPVRLDAIEKDFFTLLKKNNVDTQQVHLNNLQSNYWWYWYSNRNKVVKTKTYRIRISGDINFLRLTEDLNKKWVESINITDKDNKRLTEFKKEVRIAAIRSAKEKAIYLLESIGEQLGGVVSVEEESDEENVPWMPQVNLRSNAVLAESTPETSEVGNVSGIKLRYLVKVRFQIK